MKKLSLFLLLLTFGFVSCAQSGKSQNSGKTRVIMVIPGTLGDKSFWDGAADGLNQAAKDLGLEVKIIEAGRDQAKWEPALTEASEGAQWDIIISGAWTILETFEQVAARYPEQKYIFFDATLNHDGKNANVYSMNYKGQEGGFLMGALAAMLTTQKQERINDKKIIGFVGGMNNIGINNFLLSYIQGANYADPAIKIDFAFAGSFGDPAKGKELALAQIGRGSDIVIQAAGQTGVGVIEAAAQSKVYAIGTDSDQAVLYKESDPAKAESIITSDLKKVGPSIHRALKMYKEGSLAFGTSELLGIKEGVIDYADNEYFQKNVSPEIQSKLKQMKEDIITGKINVDSAYGMPQDEIEKRKNAAKAF